jgi:hypothetical protein
VNTVFQSYVESGNDVRLEKHMHDTVCHNGELIDSIAVLVKGARLGVGDRLIFQG